MGEIKERPILFSGPMVRAILGNKKSVTRRIVKGKFPDDEFIRRESGAGYGWWSKHPSEPLWLMTGAVVIARDAGFDTSVKCPYGVIGDRLWVRETFCDKADYAAIGGIKKNRFHYAADGKKSGWKYKPSIFMRREACRIVLEITDIRVERLHEMTEEEAVKEGFASLKEFVELWDQLNSKRGVCKTCKGHGVVPKWSGSLAGGTLMQDSEDCPDCHGEQTGFGFDSNPWVWRIEFRRVCEPTKTGDKDAVRD